MYTWCGLYHANHQIQETSTMKTTDKLGIINGESDIQKRLKLLVDHGFKAEASQLIWNMARTHTAMFHYDWHDETFCRPLPRVTDKDSAVYVIIATNSKLDYHPIQQKENDQHIIFELGWEREVLGWTSEESRQLLHTILAQALARPLNQWSFKQAEGTSRATRRLLPANESIVRQIAALYLVYHLREADFGHICIYLSNIEGFPFVDLGMKPLDYKALINWIVDQLLESGWSSDRIHKELVEWIWLKTGTWPQWLLSVAEAKVFGENDKVRAIAVRRWITQGFDNLLNVYSYRGNKKEMTEVYRQLLRLGQFGTVDESWVLDKLVQHMALGKVKSVKWFLSEFAETLGFGQLDQVRDQAIEVAKAAGNYGIAVALIKDGGKTPDRELTEIVEIRSLATQLE